MASDAESLNECATSSDSSYLPSNICRELSFISILSRIPSPVSSSGSLEMHKKVNTRYCNQIFEFFRLICGLQFHRFQLDSTLFDDKSQTHTARGSSSSSKHPLASTPSLLRSDVVEEKLYPSDYIVTCSNFLPQAIRCYIIRAAA